MNCYSNNANYSCTYFKSSFVPQVEEQYEEEEKQQQQQQQIKIHPVRKYLPGERLLKNINKQQKKQNKAKSLNMDMINKSINEIITDLL
jgi:hypothetical protein